MKRPVIGWIFCLLGGVACADESRRLPLSSEITGVQPGTGIVLWTDSDAVETDAIQLEYRYLGYDDIAVAADPDDTARYDWSLLDKTLDEVAGRGHQLVLRLHYVWPGKETNVPSFLKDRADYQERRAKADGQPTWLPDWSSPELESFTLAFYDALAERYDNDARLAYLQTGFGLWSEYHIYDGPCVLGETFPTKAYQAKFARNMAKNFRATPWMLSIDAYDEEWSPMAEDAGLAALPFGLFDDSLMHRDHAEDNAEWWHAMGAERWKLSPGGGEFSYYSKHDQKQALSPKGPHGVPFERFAADFHLAFVIGNDQPSYQSLDRIREAGMACGYRLRVTDFATSPTRVGVRIINEGVTPLYHDAAPAIDGTRAKGTLRGLLPGERRTFTWARPDNGETPDLTIQSDRLVPGQKIEYAADLSGTPGG